jgi:hypothetical protein
MVVVVVVVVVVMMMMMMMIDLINMQLFLHSFLCKMENGN